MRGNHVKIFKEIPIKHKNKFVIFQLTYWLKLLGPFQNGFTTLFYVYMFGMSSTFATLSENYSQMRGNHVKIFKEIPIKHKNKFVIFQLTYWLKLLGPFQNGFTTLFYVYMFGMSMGCWVFTYCCV